MIIWIWNDINLIDIRKWKNWINKNELEKRIKEIYSSNKLLKDTKMDVRDLWNTTVWEFKNLID